MGLSLVLPLVTKELLQFQKLCQQFFMVVSNVVSEEPILLTHLDPPVQQALLQALEFGMSHHDLMISRNSLEAISALANAYIGSETTTTTTHHTDMFGYFLSVVIRLLLSSTFSLDDLLEPVSEALLALIVCVPTHYEATVRQLISTQDYTQHERLTTAFNALVIPPPCIKPERTSREAFRDSLKKFAANTSFFMRSH